MKAWLGLRHERHYRRDVFTAGLERIGYTVEQGVTTSPGDQDILVTWNRYGVGAQAADAFEAAGRPVLVAENASWGNAFVDDRWYHLARNVHNTAGRYPVGHWERWDSLGMTLDPWREGGTEVVILPQRGIGPPGVAMPSGWPQRARQATGGRIRPHPGRGESKPLDDDLAQAKRVLTWGSGAAIKALIWGIPVVSEMPNWIGQQDNTDAGRLAMFRRLAWGQWRIMEIESGEAFTWLLKGQ